MLEYAKELERIVWPRRYQMKNAFLYIVLFVLFIHSDWCKLKDHNTILTAVRLCYCLNCFVFCCTTPLHVCLCTGNSALNYISIRWTSSWSWHLLSWSLWFKVHFLDSLKRGVSLCLSSYLFSHQSTIFSSDRPKLLQLFTPWRCVLHLFKTNNISLIHCCSSFVLGLLLNFACSLFSQHPVHPCYSCKAPH